MTLGLLSVPSSVPMLTQQGMAHLELLRLWGEVPRARLVASVTGSGATIWAYPSGGGRRRVASWRKAPVLLDYAEAFAPVGCSGRAECWSLAQAVDFAADRVLLLEAGGY